MPEILIADGYKQIADLLEMPESTVRREVDTYPDPLPVRRLGEGRVWAKPERLRLHRRRHAEGAAHPIQGLPIAEGWEKIAGFVRLTIVRCREMAPWARDGGLDPLPVHRREDGTVFAYRDALVDWLDRRSRTAGSPKYRRPWKQPASKRGRKTAKGGKSENCVQRRRATTCNDPEDRRPLCDAASSTLRNRPQDCKSAQLRRRPRATMGAEL